MKRMTTKVDEREERAEYESGDVNMRACSGNMVLPDAVQVRRALGEMKLSTLKVPPGRHSGSSLAGKGKRGTGAL